MEKVRKKMIKRINELCKEKNWSYYKLSARASVPMNTLLSIVEGRTQNPGVFTIMKICEGLGITMGELFDEEMLIMLLEEL